MDFESQAKIKTQTLAIVMMVVLVSGCGTTSSVQSGGKDITSIPGVDESEIRILNYCYYAEIMDLEEKTVDFRHCILALSGTQLHLLDENLQAASATEEVVIPIAGIDGVGLKALGATSQVQLLIEDHLIALTFIKPSPFHRDEVPQRLHDLLVSDGVPEWKCQRLYYMKNSPYDVPLFVPIPL